MIGEQMWEEDISLCTLFTFEFEPRECISHSKINFKLILKSIRNLKAGPGKVR